MSEFYVNDPQLVDAAKQITALSGQFPAARSYASTHLDIGLGDTGLLLSTIMLTTGKARTAVLDELAVARSHLDAAATELRAAAATYRTTDDAVDASLDATY
ncbi:MULTISPECIES: hypothetical protein [unclassified Actinotalea]|uniref:hypothetical protein n=1 Tax=unclassified Actinotalea TaxID=2638618 RepID=UPI0015F41133|nr:MULTISPECIES: hypothetical protein [unclassified Actinotalea]